MEEEVKFDEIDEVMTTLPSIINVEEEYVEEYEAEEIIEEQFDEVIITKPIKIDDSYFIDPNGGEGNGSPDSNIESQIQQFLSAMDGDCDFDGGVSPNPEGSDNDQPLSELKGEDMKQKASERINVQRKERFL